MNISGSSCGFFECVLKDFILLVGRENTKQCFMKRGRWISSSMFLKFPNGVALSTLCCSLLEDGSSVLVAREIDRWHASSFHNFPHLVFCYIRIAHIPYSGLLLSQDVNYLICWWQLDFQGNWVLIHVYQLWLPFPCLLDELMAGLEPLASRNVCLSLISFNPPIQFLLLCAPLASIC